MARSPKRRIVEGVVDFAVDALPDAIERPLRRAFGIERRAAPSLAVPRARPALPAPPRRLALPAPGPGLPAQASKPRGGQFYPDANLAPIDAQAAGYKLDNYTDQHGVDRYQVIRPEGTPVSGYAASTPEGGWELANAHFKTNQRVSNMSPEAAARMERENNDLYQWREGPPEPRAQLGDWLERTLAKYYKTDFGSPNDPLRDLAERGLHYDPQMTPDQWQRVVNNTLMEDPIGYFTVPRHETEIQSNLAGRPSSTNGFTFFGANDPVGQGALMQAAPWLRKQPVTDMLYGIRSGLDLSHFSDEMQNALRARETGLPMDLAVRPESLDRMTFAQAAEHVGKINQFRAKQMQQAALSAMNGPAIHTFKEYPENNPMGLRWVELKAPDEDAVGIEGYSHDLWPMPDPHNGMGDARDPRGTTLGATSDPSEAEMMFRRDAVRQHLEDALKYEGDTMGHCVGGYCDDVLSGRSRIFSLRDAKGEPHVTIETGKGDRNGAALRHLRDLGVYDDWVKYSNANRDMSTDAHDLSEQFLTERGLPPVNYGGDDIIQIKGKQNRAPKDDYLPFVQDFVKSGQWGNVGDLANTGLVRLPDGRYITRQQYDNIIDSEGLHDAYQSYDYNAHGFPHDPSTMTPDDWDYFSRHFEGYAIGGRVDADRCFCNNPLSVKKGR